MKKSINILKTYFETGDTPSQEQFWNMLESFIHIDSGVVVTDRQTDVNGTITLTFSDASSLVFPKYIPPTSQAISYIDGLQSALDRLRFGLDAKVDKVSGKGLSTNDFTDADKQKLDALQNYIPPTSQAISYIDGLQSALDRLRFDLDAKVDKVSGKGLSTNDFTDAEKQKLQDLNPKSFVRLTDETGNTIVAASGNDTLNVSGAVIDEVSRTLVVSASSSAASTHYVYVNDAEGDNTTAVAGDVTKPFSTLDAALLATIPVGESPNLHVVVVFTNNSTYTIANQIQGYCNLTFRSSTSTTLSLDKNLKNAFVGVFSSYIYGMNIDMPLGTLKSDAEGGLSCSFGHQYLDVRLNLSEIILRASGGLIVGRKVYAEPFERLEASGGGFFWQRMDSNITVDTVVVNGAANQNPFNWSNVFSRLTVINKVTGSGSMILLSKAGNRPSYVSIGDILCSQSTFVMSGTAQPENLTINFMDSTITNGIVLFRKLGALTFTGAIKSMSILSSFTGLSDGVLSLKNFIASIATCDLTMGSNMGVSLINSFLDVGSDFITLTNAGFAKTFTSYNSHVTLPDGGFLLKDGGSSDTIYVGSLSISPNAALINNNNSQGVNFIAAAQNY